MKRQLVNAGCTLSLIKLHFGNGLVIFSHKKCHAIWKSEYAYDHHQQGVMVYIGLETGNYSPWRGLINHNPAITTGLHMDIIFTVITFFLSYRSKETLSPLHTIQNKNPLYQEDLYLYIKPDWKQEFSYPTIIISMSLDQYYQSKSLKCKNFAIVC